MKARTTGASGALRYDKGDLENEDYLIEAKFTEKQNITIKGEWLSKICVESSYKGKKPALVFTLQGIADCFEKDFIVLRISDFKKLRNKDE